MVDRANAAKSDIQVFYATPYGATPLGYSVYYKAVNSFNGFYNKGFNRTQMTLPGNLTSYHQIINPQIPKELLNETTQVFFELFQTQQRYESYLSSSISSF